MPLNRTAVALENSFDPGAAAPLSAVVREVIWRAEHGLKAILVVGASAARAQHDAARAEGMGPLADPFARAIVLAGGANEAAALMSGRLAAAGIAVAQLDPRRAALGTSGHTLDARPRHADARWYQRTLAKVGVVVVPGGVGLDSDRRVTHMGEGGAALSAAFLADTLGLELLIPGDAARARVDQIPGRKARLMARDRGVRVRGVEPSPSRRRAQSSDPRERLFGTRAVSA